MNRSMRGLVSALAAALMLSILGAEAADAARRTTPGARPFGAARPKARPTAARLQDALRRVDVNQINMYVTNVGSIAYDFEAQDAGLWWPKGSTQSAVYAAGLWLGAQVGGETRIAMAEYEQEFGAGAMNGALPDDSNRPEYVVYKMVRLSGARDAAGNLVDTLRVLRSAEEQAADPNLDPVLHHSWTEYRSGAVPFGAPTRLYRLPDDSTPAPDDSVDIEGPDVLGDQMLWCVYNDADPAKHNSEAGSTSPLGVEVQQTTFAFDRQGALGQTLFIKYLLINKGGNTLDSMFVSQWSDPDLGGAAGFTDDLVGCDTLPDGTGQPRSLGYVYNSQDPDPGYGKAPPALGFDFFQGPLVAGNRLGLASFNKYINGTDPQNANETYNYMKGLYPSGDIVVDPFGVATRYFVAGDPISPIAGASWLDTAPDDRRMLMSAGPFTMAPGDTQEVVVGIIIGKGSSRLSSISALKFNDEFAQDAFNKNFDLPAPPAQPVVNASEDHGEITLSWDTNSRANYVEPGYAFQGYVVYQGASRSGPWTRLETYDEKDNVRIIKDAVFDPTTGQIITDYPVAFGSDLGVRYTHTTTQDAVRGTPLFDGTDYYFAVTSYSYNPTGVPKVLENAQTVVAVLPQRPASGTDLASASAADVEHVLKDPNLPAGTDEVIVEVVNPELVTGHTYKVTFEPTVPLFSGIVGGDTATVKHSWSLIDSTDGNQVLLSGQLNRRGDDDYQVVDGIRVKVQGEYFGTKAQDAFYTNVGPNPQPFEGINFGMDFFDGGAGYPVGHVAGMASTLDPVAQPDSFSTVELRFSNTDTQMAYRYYRLENASDAGAPLGRRYAHSGRFPIAFQAWDVKAGVQLDVGFVERVFTEDDGTYLPDAQQPASQDSIWNPSDDDLGDREYLIVFRSAYSVADKPELQVALEDGTAPVMWQMNVRRPVPGAIIDDGDKFTFQMANPATDNDVYVFSTQALQRGNTSLAAGKLSSIRAVPNPYYAHSLYETDQFNRKLRFMNLPERCTIRIYNLAGQQVRRLEKNDATTSVLTWDLFTENQLPVGSGVYIFHVEAPGAGEYTGRVVVFMEKERLNSF